MHTPRVSICLPNLNNRPYLEERIETILAQTFTDWELVICDNYSDDGAWEFFQQLAGIDARVRISQEPREGMYANWNNCIREARGEFVYVATSDDTMAPDCLEKLVKALDNNPDCGLAHCPMRVIDQHGAPGRDWWSASSLFVRSAPGFEKIRHKRLAPYDGVLCLLGDNIYSSVTQLLIRRSLYDKIGLYKADWGSLGDFHWNLRAALATHTIHLPDTWGGWRMHPSQATHSVGLNSPQHQAKIDAMIRDALLMLRERGILIDGDHSFAGLEQRAAEIREYLRAHASQPSGVARKCFLLREALHGNRAARGQLAALLPGRRKWPNGAPETVSSWFAHEVLLPTP